LKAKTDGCSFPASSTAFATGSIYLREPKAGVDRFELEEAARLINAAAGQDRAIITVLIFCGLRPNEALALRWQDMDFDRRILKIRRTIRRLGGIGLPKTASSRWSSAGLRADGKGRAAQHTARTARRTEVRL
jgi:integrase